MPGAPSSFLLLVVGPGAPSSVLASSDALTQPHATRMNLSQLRTSEHDDKSCDTVQYYAPRCRHRRGDLKQSTSVRDEMGVE